ncbi:MAG TPA: methyltransferase domain-containing protein, partial [Rheinheimera sp.]|nr:methyltransferase domain-containing protein [Rheinheimera sp.]
MSSETIDYYNQHAAEYVQATVNVDMAELYAEFVPLVKTGGHILDAGCGSGRDAWHFKQLGFSVSAFDASAELATIASQRLKQPVTVQ